MVMEACYILTCLYRIEFSVLLLQSFLCSFLAQFSFISLPILSFLFVYACFHQFPISPPKPSFMSHFLSYPENLLYSSSHPWKPLFPPTNLSNKYAFLSLSLVRTCFARPSLVSVKPQCLCSHRFSRSSLLLARSAPLLCATPESWRTRSRTSTLVS